MTQSRSLYASFSHSLAHLFSSSLWPVMIAAALLILTGIGLRDPWPADEPRFALVAKEMVETGQWFFPARAQELYPDKPPIFMWAIAAFYWLTGSINIAFLLPSALCGLLTIFLVYDITRRLWDKKTAIVAAWLLLFSLQFLLQAKTAQIDAMVCAWITIGCYGLLRYCLVDGQYRWYALAWFFMGIGVITKGVGFISLLMLLPYCWYRWQARQTPSVVKYAKWTWSIGPLIMLGAISLWFIPMLIIVAQSDNGAFELYRDNILFKQTVTRYADSWHHVKPAWYYITSVVPVFWLPAISALPWLLKPWAKAIKALDARIILPLGFMLLVLIFFSASPGKRGVYIFPALPMLILATAPYYRYLMSKAILKNIMLGLTALLSIGLSVFAGLGLAESASTVKLAAKFDMQPWYFFLIVGLGGLLGLIVSWRQNKWLAWPLLMTVLWLSYSTYGYGLRKNASTPIAVYEKAQEVLAEHHEQAPEIALVEFSEQFILFSPYPMYHFGYHTPTDQQLNAAYQWQQDPHQYLLLEDTLLENSCFDASQSYDLGFAHRRHWLLVPLAAKRADCGAAPSDIPVYFYQRQDPITY